MSPIRIEENVALAPLTTLKVGGAARFYTDAESEADLLEAVEFARSRDLPVFILGGGSNILVSDRGFAGLVIHVALRGIDFRDDMVTAAAGEDWDEFCAKSVARNLAGIECLSGIPGLVGGTPVQNVGAYGQEVSDSIVTVRALDLESGTLVELSNAECRFGYRRSIFNTDCRGRYVVTSVTFRLALGGSPLIAYKDLKSVFGDRIPSLAETRETVCRIRESKGMLVRQGGADSQSAGSFFKNPVVGKAVFDGIRDRFSSIPGFESPDGSVKIPAAWLIEQSGFAKGFVLGRAGLSTCHTLAVTNRGGATASEIVRLKDLIAERVRDVFGIELAVEPIFVGFD